MIANINLATYYAYLKSGDWSKKRPELPDDTTELFSDWSTKKSFKRINTSCNVVLNVSFKQQTVQMRKENLKRTNNGTAKDVISLARLDAIPKELLNNESYVVHISVLLFLMTNMIKDSFRKDLIFALLEGKLSFKTTQDAIDELKNNFNDLKVKIQKLKPDLQYDDKFVTVLIRTLLDTSDLLNNKNYARLAMSIDGAVYTKILQTYTHGRPDASVIEKRDCFKTVAPYEPLFNQYICVCVALKDQESERIKIQKQFKVNKYDVFNDIMTKLPPVESSSTAAKPKTIQTFHFDNNETYFVYESKTNFMKSMSYSEIEHNGKKYMILVYSQCIFDILGDSQYGKDWQQRLDAIPGLTKIQLDKRTGFELNNYKSNSVLGVSWLDKNGQIAFRVHIPKRDTSIVSVTSTTDLVNGIGGGGGDGNIKYVRSNTPSYEQQTDIEDDDNISFVGSKAKRVRTSSPES